MRNKKVQGLDRKIRELNSKYDKSERQSKEQQKLLSEQKQECSSYIKEIEEIGKELEELQNQNARILQQLSEKDDCNNRLIKDVYPSPYYLLREIKSLNYLNSA